jgi:hypothetical protein
VIVTLRHKRFFVSRPKLVRKCKHTTIVQGERTASPSSRPIARLVCAALRLREESALTLALKIGASRQYDTSSAMAGVDRRLNGARCLAVPYQPMRTSGIPQTILTGIRYAATIALIAVIVSEMLAGKDGLGFMIFKKSFANRTADVFALMFAVAVTGVVLNSAVGLLRRAVVGWHREMSARHE